MRQTNKVFIHAISCLRRRIDAERISQYFFENNFKIVDNPKEADYIVLFTCGFHDQIINRCLDAIRHFQKFDAELILAGCLPAIARQKVERIFNGTIIPTENLDKIDEKFPENLIKLNKVPSAFSPWDNVAQLPFTKKPARLKNNPHKKQALTEEICTLFTKSILTKMPVVNHIYAEKIFEEKYYAGYTLLISRGCIHNCSYCSIKKAIGPLKSKPISLCLEEFKKGLDDGYTQFVLEADDVGVYGLDIESNIINLLNQMTSVEGDYLIRLGVTHPTFLLKHIEEIEEMLKRKKIKSIVLSIQSGSNKILDLMRRPYTKEEIKMLISRLRIACPDLEIGGQFIIGFPIESAKDFDQTYELIKTMDFDYGGVFKYSDVEGTESFTMVPKVPEKEKRKRMNTIFSLLKKTHDYTWNTGRSISFFNKK